MTKATKENKPPKEKMEKVAKEIEESEKTQKTDQYSGELVSSSVERILENEDINTVINDIVEKSKLEEPKLKEIKAAYEEGKAESIPASMVEDSENLPDITEQTEKIPEPRGLSTLLGNIVGKIRKERAKKIQEIEGLDETEEVRKKELKKQINKLKEAEKELKERIKAEMPSSKLEEMREEAEIPGERKPNPSNDTEGETGEERPGAAE